MEHGLIVVLLTLVCTLPKCLCRVPVAADCPTTATNQVCIAQDLYVVCAGTAGVAPLLSTATACPTATPTCYEELQAQVTACAAPPPPCNAPGVFPHATVGPRTFYTCLQTGAGYEQIIETCDVGYNFNKDTSKCESIANPPVKPVCMYPGQRFVDLNDCRHFRACNLGGQVVTKQCPFRLKFDASLFICTTNANCGSRPSTILI